MIAGEELLETPSQMQNQCHNYSDTHSDIHTQPDKRAKVETIILLTPLLPFLKETIISRPHAHTLYLNLMTMTDKLSVE